MSTYKLDRAHAYIGLYKAVLKAKDYIELSRYEEAFFLVTNIIQLSWNNLSDDEKKVVGDYIDQRPNMHIHFKDFCKSGVTK